MTEGTLLTALDPGRLAQLQDTALDATPEMVERALAANHVGLTEFLALISPAALPYTESIAQKARRLTRERFGKVVGLYAPVYLSNECTNGCLYCGFNHKNDLSRVTLDIPEVLSEAKILWEQGFRNLLLVSGEHPKAAPVEYLERAVRAVAPLFPSLALEVYPLEVDEYKTLSDAGVEGVTLYQETYNPDLYASVHPSGKKRDFRWRLATPSRAGEAGMRRLGIGALLGLGPWRYEAIALALHAEHLQKRYWRSSLSISFPRMRAAAGGFTPACPVGDREMVQMMLALRLLHPDVGLVLSTREPAYLRDGLAPICVTMMSAGSRTEPGGYNHPGEALEQFSIADERSPQEIARMLDRAGLEPVWKDWDTAFWRKAQGE